MAVDRTHPLTVSTAVLRPMVTLNAEQTQAFQRATELVRRWAVRDGKPDLGS